MNFFSKFFRKTKVLVTPKEYFIFSGKQYDKAEWKLVNDPSDSPPFHEMGPGYIWICDKMVVRR